MHDRRCDASAASRLAVYERTHSPHMWVVVTTAALNPLPLSSLTQLRLCTFYHLFTVPSQICNPVLA